MGKIDAATKDFMSDNRNFADAFNLALFGGERVLEPETLKPLDSAALAQLFSESDSDLKQEAVQLYRDHLNSGILKSNGSITYAAFGVENQADIHLAMPVRNNLYDAIYYASQVKSLGQRNRRENRIHDSGAFLSGLTENDRLHPVITLVIYWGPKHWNAPRSIWEMLKGTDSRILKYVPNYTINLLTPRDVPELEGYHDSEFWKIMRILTGASQSRQAFQQIFSDGNVREMHSDTVRLMNTLLNTHIPVRKGNEVINVWKAIQEINEMYEDYGRVIEEYGRISKDYDRMSEDYQKVIEENRKLQARLAEAGLSAD